MSNAPSPPRPTRVRLAVLFLTTMLAVFLYVDRICLSFTERYVKEDLRLDETSMAILLSSFFWAYALAQVPAGSLADRFGQRIMLTIFLAGWSAFTGMLGLASTLFWLIVLRLACGLFEAGAYPGAAGVIGRWIPQPQRGLASGIVSLGGRLGGATAPILTAYLMVAFVPLSTSSLLTERDLLDVPALLARLDPTGTGPADEFGRRLRDSFPTATSDLVRRARFVQAVEPGEPHSLAHFLSDIEEVLIDPRPLHDAILVGDDPALSRQLVAGLNAALEQPSLLFDVNWKKFDLPAEATRLADAKYTKPEEVTRRNRLLLEAAFPESIAKIYGGGWRPVMVVYGLAGIIVAGLFWWYVRDRPEQHPSCNAAEVALIHGTHVSDAGAAGHVPTQGAEHTHRPPAFPLRHVLVSVSLWMNALVQFFTNVAWVFLITWLPRFLVERFNVSVVERGWMSSLPTFAGIAGMFAGGLLTDWLARRIGRRWGRALPISLTRFGMAAAFVVCILLEAPWPVAIALGFVGLVCDLGLPALWAYVLDTGGKNVGAVLGWGNMYGNLGAALSPLILQWIRARHGWDGVFWFCAAIMALAGVLSLFIDATRPIVPEGEAGS